ncbi:hypothetical protein N7517_010304 [Penicillium concentricum]|uniref:Aminoglycoside phosphotransferase domain-containing protein n=1 Tax=Penicillium concentricum TaxID=293559 RepID=A0A9W9R9X4_9EURO|nr:uncharacterized protein N7517_010304 [Penicillium concentricum]KAJ5355695.1 hypothetical protein N7517_010304 [Penicillium concentricum]
MLHTLDHQAPASTMTSTPASAMASTITDLSDEDIARLCHGSHNPNPREYGRCLKRISDDVIVKFGWSVTVDEAANQKYAHILSCDTNIKVPEVYRNFSRSGMGYIVMEFIHGDPLDKTPIQNQATIIQNLANSLYALSTALSPDYPGPRNRGIPRGYLFSEDGAGKPLDTISKINSWFNERAKLPPSERDFNFELPDCVFCHMDLSQRNIIVRDDFLYILDWEFAGFYPREFETYSILFIGQKEDSRFAQDLSRALENAHRKFDRKLNDELIINLLDRVYCNNLKYNFEGPLFITAVCE